jgi:hypothetical protein
MPPAAAATGSASQARMTNKTVPEKQFDANESARISAALIAAIAEAQTLAADGKIGAEFRELLHHSRECTTYWSSTWTAVRNARGLAESIGTHLDELEAALKRDLN